MTYQHLMLRKNERKSLLALKKKKFSPENH